MSWKIYFLITKRLVLIKLLSGENTFWDFHINNCLMMLKFIISAHKHAFSQLNKFLDLQKYLFEFIPCLELWKRVYLCQIQGNLMDRSMKNMDKNHIKIPPFKGVELPLNYIPSSEVLTGRKLMCFQNTGPRQILKIPMWSYSLKSGNFNSLASTI